MNDAEGASAESPDGETRLAWLAVTAGPLRRTLAALCARLLDTGAYERLCYARLGDYARERAGVSVRQIQDLAHAHRAFAGLPRLERALVENELPWSKVRILTRVATSDDEEAWISHAQSRPIRELEQSVREARKMQNGPNDPEADEPRVSVRVRCTPAVREKWLQVRELAEQVAGQRLRPEEALEWVVAEAFSDVSSETARSHQVHAPPGSPSPFRSADRARTGLTADCGGSSSTAGEVESLRTAAEREGKVNGQVETGTDPPRMRTLGPSDHASASLEHLVAGLDEVDAFELDRRLREALRLEQALDAEIAPLLRLVTSSEYEWKTRLWTLAGYAGERLGMSASKARALLRIERAGDICPELREAFRSGSLSWVKAQCLLPLLLLDIPGDLLGDDRPSDAPPDWRSRWVAWAERVTLRRLETDVERALLLRAGFGAAFERCKHDPERTQDPIPESERQMCAHSIDVEATQRLEWWLPRDVAWLFRAVQADFHARLRTAELGAASESAVFAAVLDHAISTWTLHDPTRRRPNPVFGRDGYRCAVPGCSSHRNLHDHHIVFRSAGGSDALGNRITLCAFHHQRHLHARRLRIQGQAPDRLLFELGVRPDAVPLMRYRSGDVAL